MSNDPNRPLSEFSLLDLFRVEADQQTLVLVNGLLALDRNTDDLRAIDTLMRAAHSIKGAASIVNLQPVVHLAHAMEDCLISAQSGTFKLTRDKVDLLLLGVDVITKVSRIDDAATDAWFAENQADIDDIIGRISASQTNERVPDLPASNSIVPRSPAALSSEPPPLLDIAEPSVGRVEQVLKISAENFDRLLALTSESVIASHMLDPFLHSMHRFKKKQSEAFSLVDDLHQALAASGADPAMKDRAVAALQKINPLKQMLIDHLAELETFARRLTSASQNSLREVLALRMRPFRDGVQAFPRVVRDLARSMDKEVRLVISGEETPVDRDILASLESPINHILRNAVDHGMEHPEQRIAVGKPREGTIHLTARHRAGMLSIVITDDGQGVDLEKIRARVIQRNMASAQMAATLSKTELLDFLFLPAFSLKDATTEISGRGVGLDVVHETIRQQYGTVKIESEAGKNFQTSITLPLTQSVVRSLIVQIAAEPYAIPITRIDRVLRLERSMIRTLEDKPFFTLDGEHIGLVSGAQLFGKADSQSDTGDLAVVIIGTDARRYGIAVDVIIGGKNLAVQPINAIFGKLRDISAAGLLDDGTPVLVLDIDDVLLSIDKLFGEGQLRHLQAKISDPRRKVKRVLVVDDSLTVREMERKLLISRGFEVEVAVDGIDGWNAVRSIDYDLVITDVDMPRMDGIELVTLIKKDQRLHVTPVMIVSYKDRPEDRARGIAAGADYYLTKGSFHDEALLEAVFDLIGDGST